MINRYQKWVVAGCIVVVTAMFFFPPFQHTASGGQEFDLGYGWLFEPPGGATAHVNVPLLLAQWVGVLIVGFLTFLLCGQSDGAPSGDNLQGTDSVPADKGLGEHADTEDPEDESVVEIDTDESPSGNDVNRAPPQSPTETTNNDNIIEQQCPFCLVLLRVPSEDAGTAGMCMRCGSSIVFKADEAQSTTGGDEGSFLLHECPSCKQRVRISVSAAGHRWMCARCGSFSRIRAESSSASTESGGGPSGISGWLIIPGLGLLFAPVKSVVELVLGFKMVQEFAPELLGDNMFMLTVILDVAMLAATVGVAVLFFGRRRVAIPAVICLLVASVGVSFLQAFLSVGMLGEADEPSFTPTLYASIYAAVWINYFLKSKRVRNTFVR
jgi:uncharacterized protein DUF2569